MRGGPTETGSIIWWRVQRSQANCIKFIGCGADSTLVDEVGKSGSDPGLAFQTGPVQTILKSRVYLCTRLLLSHPGSQACQGYQIFLSSYVICLNIRVHVLRARY